METPYKSAPYWAFLVFAVTALGFWPSFFTSLGTAPAAFHVHGITATAWIILVGFQSWSIHHEKTKWHRTIGKSSLVLFPFLAAGLVMIINVSSDGYLDSDNIYYQQIGPSFAWGVAVAFLAYLWFFLQALRWRKNVYVHSAYMLSTLFLIWEAPVSRLILRYVPAMSVEGPGDFLKISYAIIAGITMAMFFALFLFLRDPAHRKPFLLASVFMGVQIGGFLYLAEPDSRSNLFIAYAQLPHEITVGAGFVLASFIAWVGWRYVVDIQK